MIPMFRRVLVSAILLFLVLLSGLLQVPAAIHSLHHGHHSAASHADPLCSWLCTAGQVIHADIVFVPSLHAPVADLSPCFGSVLLTSLSLASFSRGPPPLASV